MLHAADVQWSKAQSDYIHLGCCMPISGVSWKGPCTAATHGFQPTCMCINTVFGAEPGYTGRKSEKQQSTMSSTGQQALQNRQTWPQIAAVPPAVLTCMRMPCRTHAGVTSETEIQATITLCQAVQTVAAGSSSPTCSCDVHAHAQNACSGNRQTR